jgi:hypothetical protein
MTISLLCSQEASHTLVLFRSGTTLRDCIGGCPPLVQFDLPRSELEVATFAMSIAYGLTQVVCGSAVQSLVKRLILAEKAN